MAEAAAGEEERPDEDAEVLDNHGDTDEYQKSASPAEDARESLGGILS